MWLGLLYSPSDNDAQVVFSAWTSDGDRPFTVAGSTDDAAGIARALRNAASGGGIGPPRCDGCSTPVDLPPL